MAKKNLDNAMMHCYRELYANATPPASFTVNEQGQKVIPFLDYEIEEDMFEEIVTDTIKIYKINKSFLKQAFRFTIMMGCSPKFIRKSI